MFIKRSDRTLLRLHWLATFSVLLLFLAKDIWYIFFRDYRPEFPGFLIPWIILIGLFLVSRQFMLRLFFLWMMIMTLLAPLAWFPPFGDEESTIAYRMRHLDFSVRLWLFWICITLQVVLCDVLLRLLRAYNRIKRNNGFILVGKIW
jgi:hypothetical protein